MKNILVLCTGNSCRSQLAHGYLEFFTNDKEIAVFSAGIETHGVNPKAIEIMLEEGIDISTYTSNLITEYEHIKFDVILTVCDNAKERCPYFPGKAKKFHMNFQDPAKAIGNEEEVFAVFRKVRDQIKIYCKQFIEDNVNQKSRT